jgi:bloom syndrome protein
LFLEGRRKLELVIPRGDDGDAPVRKSKKKGKEKERDASEEPEPAESSRAGKQRARAPPSTNVSSPVRVRSKKSRKRNPFVDDEASDEDNPGAGGSDDIDPAGDLHNTGYERDGFVVSDIDEGSDVEHFDPPRRPVQRRRQQRLEELGARISHGTFEEVGDLPEIHQALIPSFVEEAKRKEEDIRNGEGLRRTLFKERQFRDMAAHWTVTLDLMHRIVGISTENVDKYGARFLPIVKKYRADYLEMMGEVDPELADVVDLISSDEDGDDRGHGHPGGGAAFDDDDFDDDEEEEAALEASRFFGSRGDGGGPSGQGGGSRQAAAPAASRNVQSWHEQLQSLDSQSATRGASVASSAANNSRGGGYRGRRNNYRRGSGGGRGGGGGFPKRAAGGVAKRRSSAGASRSASAGSFRGGAAGGSGGGAGRGGKAGKSTAKKVGGGGQSVLSAGAGGIGLMPL